MAGGTGVPADEGGTRTGSPRGPLLAGVPPPRLPGDAGVRVPGVGTVACEAEPGPAGKKGGKPPTVTLPSIRRALQKMLAPVCRHDCEYCRGQAVTPPQKLTE